MENLKTWCLQWTIPFFTNSFTGYEKIQSMFEVSPPFGIIEHIQLKAANVVFRALLANAQMTILQLFGVI